MASNELKAFVYALSFLGLVVVLIGVIPPDFYIAESMRSVNVLDSWEGINLQNFAETWNDTTLYVDETDFDIGGRNLQWASEYPSVEYMILHQKYGFGLLWREAGTWYDRNGIQVSFISDFPISEYQQIDAQTLNDEYTEHKSCEFIIRFYENDPFHVQVFFTFNETAYANPTLAWANDELNVLIGIGFDEVGTSYNAWDLVGMLLFFQMPDTDPNVNRIIAIPIFGAIAIVAFLLIIKVIPLIGG